MRLNRKDLRQSCLWLEFGWHVKGAPGEPQQHDGKEGINPVPEVFQSTMATLYVFPHVQAATQGLVDAIEV